MSLILSEFFRELIEKVLDKVKQSRQNNSQSNRDSITTEGQAAIAEQERIVREGARLIDVV